MGFSAYALTQNMDDPLSVALHGLIDEASAQSVKIEAILAALDKLGVCPERTGGAEFDPNKLNAMVD
jgi:serine O-acetyltransferase